MGLPEDVVVNKVTPSVLRELSVGHLEEDMTLSWPGNGTQGSL